MDASVSGQGPVADSFEHGNELSGSIKSGKFLPPNIAETFSQSEPNTGFNSQTSIQPKDKLLVGIISHLKQIHMSRPSVETSHPLA
jgi:hypothetical protein